MAFVGEVCPLRSPLEERDRKSVLRNIAGELVTDLAQVHGVREKIFNFVFSVFCK